MTETDLFFKNDQAHFFGCLTGKYREITVSCIRNLYGRLNGPEADYAYHLTRKDLIDIFFESIRITPLLDDDTSDGGNIRMASKDLPAFILKRLKDSGWIEAYMDPGNMQTAYRFTAMGRRFAAPFMQKQAEVITSTQNTRSTLSHLKTFITQLENGVISTGDLMIAAKLSGEIIGDFNEIIEEIVEQRRELIHSVTQKIQAAKAAGDHFFEFMDKRLIPDMSVRFSQDSVERYKYEIIDLLNEVREKPDKTKVSIEKELLKHYGYLQKEDRPSILIWSLDLIERRLSAACDVKIPELRSQTENFIRRAHVLISHLASIAAGDLKGESIFSLVKSLAGMEKDAVEALLSHPDSRFPLLSLGLINPERVRLLKGRTKRKIETILKKEHSISKKEQQDAYIRREISLAFGIEASAISDYVVQQIGKAFKIEAKNFIIHDAASLICALHAPMIGNVRAGKKGKFKVIPMNEQIKNEYYSGDNFIIERVLPPLKASPDKKNSQGIIQKEIKES